MMGRKSITSAVISLPVTHQDIWEAVMNLGKVEEPFQVNHVEKIINHNMGRDEIEPRSIGDYLRRLTKAGYLKAEKIKNGHKLSVHQYTRTAKEGGMFAPSVERDGTELANSMPGTLKMWRVMKVLPNFDYIELAATAETHTENARCYVKALYKAKILSLCEPAKTGRLSAKARYRLPADQYTGPHAPQILKIKAVYDPNTGNLISIDSAYERLKVSA